MTRSECVEKIRELLAANGHRCLRVLNESGVSLHVSMYDCHLILWEIWDDGELQAWDVSRPLVERAECKMVYDMVRRYIEGWVP